MRLLIVEDDAMIGESLQRGLKADGHAADWVQRGEDALAAVLSRDYDMVLLDLGLPDKPGLEVLSDLRAAGNETPVVILTAKDAVGDRVGGLDAGADDYIVKPFSFEELEARMRAVQRRRQGRSDKLSTSGVVTLNSLTKELSYQGQTGVLSQREFAIMEALLARPGLVLSRAQLEERLYGWNEEVGSNAVEVHIHQLRKKFGKDIIRNMRGLGYMVAKS